MNSSVYFIEWNLVSLSSCSITMTLLIDWMPLLFMSFVMLISSLVILYSHNYMLGDVSLNRFIFLVLMIVLSMIFLIRYRYDKLMYLAWKSFFTFIFKFFI